MTDELSGHLDNALRHASEGVTETPIPCLTISVGRATEATSPNLYRSIICFILRASKEVALNENLLRFDPCNYSMLD